MRIGKLSAALSVLALVVVGVAALGPVAAQDDDCREAKAANGETVLQCRGPDGHWYVLHKSGSGGHEDRGGDAAPGGHDDADAAPGARGGDDDDRRSDAGGGGAAPGGGLPHCDARAEPRNGAVTLRIVSAHLSDRPDLTYFQGMLGVTRDVKGYWIADYEVISHLNGPLQWSDIEIGNKAIDSSGNSWSGMRVGSIVGDKRSYQPGERKRGRLTFITYDRHPNPSEIRLHVSAHIAANINSNPYLDFDFRGMPINCTDDESGRPAAAGDGGGAPPGGDADATPAGLTVPVQSWRTGMLKPDAPQSSVKFAVQCGFIYAYSQGVLPNFDQALAWYREAERRQNRQHDFTLENDIRRMIASLSDTRIIDLLQKGQQQSAMGSWEDAQMYFGHAAILGDVQGMAAYGYTFSVGNNRNAQAEIYWCRKAYRGAKANGLKEFEIDAVNYFCPEETFDGLMSPKEKRDNRISIARAAQKSAAIRREAQEISDIARAFIESAHEAPSGGRLDPTFQHYAYCNSPGNANNPSC